MEIENFSGTTPRVIAQDYHATLRFANGAAVVYRDAQEAFDTVKAQGHRKSATYRLDFNLTVGRLQDRSLNFFVYARWPQRTPAGRCSVIG